MITTIPRIAHLPGAKPQWCWCDAIDSTNVQVWWSDRSSDEDLFDIQRSADGGLTWQTLVADLPSDSKARNHTTWYRYSTFLGTTVRPPNFDNQIKYTDTTAQPDSRYLYRVRAKKTGGVDASGWSRSFNHVITPPNDILPARVHDPHVRQVPNCQGVIHTPQNSSELNALLAAPGFSRGDIIELRSDVVYTGPFIFPRLSTPLTGNRDQDYVLVRTNNWQQLPSEGERVVPGDAINMPKCTANTNNIGVFNLAQGASYYWFLGIHFDRGNPASPRSTGLFDSFIPASSPATDLDIANNDTEVYLSDFLHNGIVIDRSYFFGGAETEDQGMAILIRDANQFAVMNCYMENFKNRSEKHTILVIASFGPILIENNWLVNGSSMCLFSAQGSAPGMGGAVDMTVRRNVMGTAPKYDRRSFSFDPISEGGQIEWTDAEIDAVNPSIIKRPGSSTFANTRQGDMIEILSGTGFAPGRYRMIGGNADLSPNQMLLNRPAGTTGSTGGTVRRGGSWDIKNTFESKSSLRLLFEENIFLGCPEVGQPGYKMFFGPRVKAAPWERTHWTKAAFDVTVRWNHFTNYEGYFGFQIDDTQESESAAVSLGGRRVLYENNLIEDTLHYTESLFQPNIGEEWPTWRGFTVRHNTFVGRRYPADTIAGRDDHGRGAFVFGDAGVKLETGSLIGNIFTIGTFGVHTVGAGSEFDLAPSLAGAIGPGFESRDNVWIDVDDKLPTIPASDVSTPDFEDVFIDWLGKDFRIKPAFQGIVSPPVLRGQTDPGCDIDELRRRLQGVFSGRKPKHALVFA